MREGFGGVFLRRRRRRRRIARRMRKTAIITPRAMPTFALSERPLDLEVDEEEEDDVLVAIAEPSVPVGGRLSVVTVAA